MKAILLACALLLTACGGGGGGSPTGPVPAAVNPVPVARAPTLYQGQGVFAPYAGLEPTAIVEGGLVRLWYTAEDNSGSGGAYPFTNVRVAYRETSAAAFAAAVKAGQPISWTGQGDVAPLMHAFVAKGPDGVYNLIGTNVSTGQGDLWTSTTGYPGTWTLAHANILPIGATLGNVSANWNGSAWDLWLEYARSQGAWRVSYWSGPTLDALTRQDSDAAPAMVGAAGTTVSVGQVVKVGPRYIHFAHSSLTSAPTPTQISIWSSASPGAGWKQDAWVLTLAEVPMAFNSDSQLADPTLIEIDGSTFMLYETIREELFDVPSLSVAWWPASLAGVVSAVEGQP